MKVTIPDVVYVIDTGKVKMKNFSAEKNLDFFDVRSVAYRGRINN